MTFKFYNLDNGQTKPKKIRGVSVHISCVKNLAYLVIRLSFTPFLLCFADNKDRVKSTVMTNAPIMISVDHYTASNISLIVRRRLPIAQWFMGR